MRKRLISGLLTGVMALSLVACGGASGTGTSDNQSGSDKVWKIATDTSFKPFEYTDNNGDFVGIDMDILAAVAEDQGFKYEVQVLG